MSASTRWETVSGSIHTITKKESDLFAGFVDIRLSVLTLDGQRVGQVVRIDGTRLADARFDLLAHTLDRMVRDLDVHGPMR